MRTQIFNQKTPLLIITDNPKNVDYLKKAVVDIARNIKALVVRNDIRQNVQPFTVETPFNVDELQALLKQKESEILEFYGIDSQSPFQKKSQIINAEQESNGQILTYLINDRYIARKNALDKLRTKGLDITISKVEVENLNIGGGAYGTDETV